MYVSDAVRTDLRGSKRCVEDYKMLLMSGELSANTWVGDALAVNDDSRLDESRRG